MIIDLINNQNGSGNTSIVKACYDSTTAFYPHAVGDIIYFDSHFYRVTSAIAVNDAIAVNTNITAANLAANTVVYVEKLPGSGGSKEDTTITLSQDTASLSYDNLSEEITMTTNSDGEVSVTSSDTDVATVSYSNGVITITCGSDPGSATITVSIAETSHYKEGTTTISVTNTALLKAFNVATDSEIATMVTAADQGKIDLYDDAGWEVGQEHEITLSAMAATGVSEAHAAQTATLVIMNKGGKVLNNAVKDKTGGDRTICSFVVGLKNGLIETGYMNSSDTNSGGWDSCARRSWCNSVFRNAIPSALKNTFKQFINHTANGSESSAVDSVDYFALPSEKEVYGSAVYSNATAEAANNRFSYYETSEGIIKKKGDSGSASNWWQRSPYNGKTTAFCRANPNGSSGYNGMAASTSNMAVISPFGCL